MEEEIINEYKKAGSTWKSVIAYARKEAKDGVKLLDLAEKIENKIIEEDCGIAFPVNLSINEEAAHFTPTIKDEKVLDKTDLLKIDIGVHSNGYICDGAISINLDNKHAKQIEANELALANAISVTKFGTEIDAVGREIENTLKEKGFKPVYNLSGHGLDKNNIHSNPQLPNHSNASTQKLEEGAIAIEPFASTGEGFVSESSQVEIFALNEGRNVRNIHARKILEIGKKYGGLPFAERWLRKESKLDEFQFNLGLRELMKTACFETFPGLKEIKGIFVTQVEKSLIVLEDKTIVLGE